jgi:Flp pilus assembly protein TadG
MKHSRTVNESGAAAILVAGVLVFLMGFAWLAIDGGMGFDDRRGTQNAADLAALAAAWQECNRDSTVPGGTVAEEAVYVAREKAGENGYPHATSGGFPQVDVSDTGAFTWTVTITEENDTVFGAAGNAPRQIQVVSTATAECREVGILDGYAVFGFSSSCTINTVSLAGSNTDIIGGVHSNDDLHIPNSSATVTGPATYRGDPPTSSGVDAEKYFGSPLEYPLDFDFGEFAPAGSRATAAAAVGNYYSWTSSAGRNDIRAASPDNGGTGTDVTIGAPGIYYTAGDFDLNSSDITLVGDALDQGVTFIARGEIKMKSLDDIHGYEPLIPGGSLPILAAAEGYQTYGCTDKDIKISGSGISWEGLLYAPFGQVDISASTVGAFNGSIIAYTVSVAASSFTITYQDDPAFERTYRINLLQ